MASRVLPSLNNQQGSGLNQRANSRISPNNRHLPRRTDMIKVSSPDHPIQLKPRIHHNLFSEKTPTTVKVSMTPKHSNAPSSFNSTPQKSNPCTPITIRHVTSKNQQLLKVSSHKSSPQIKMASSKTRTITKSPSNPWLEVKNQADEGNLEAMFIYANILFTGRGVLIDRTGARKYFQKAADGGHCKAQIQFADILLNGWGVPKNPQIAVKYLKKAAETENLDAVYTLAGCFRDGIGVKKNLAEAENRFKFGADKGHAGCQFGLAQMLEGKGNDFREEALSYYQKATNQGFPLASNNFLRLLNKKV